MTVSELQLWFARDRASVISAILPNTGHTCQDQPNVTCFMCNVTQTPRIELYDDGSENGVLCDLYLGENLVERFYPAEFMP